MIHRNPHCQSVQQYRGATDYGDLAPEHSKEARTPIKFFRGCIRGYHESSGRGNVSIRLFHGVSMLIVILVILHLTALAAWRDGPALDRPAKDSGLISHT